MCCPSVGINYNVKRSIVTHVCLLLKFSFPNFGNNHVCSTGRLEILFKESVSFAVKKNGTNVDLTNRN